MAQWKIQDAYETYGVRNWGKGYFGINDKGNVTVHPNKKPEQAIDLKDLVDQLQERVRSHSQAPFQSQTQGAGHRKVSP